MLIWIMLILGWKLNTPALSATEVAELKLLKESLDDLCVELHRFGSMLVMMAISILLKYIMITSLKW